MASKDSTQAAMPQASLFDRVFRKHAWEWMLVGLLVVINAINAGLSPYYLTKSLLDSPMVFLDKAFLALSMSYVLMIGEIDISVASTVALSATLMGVSFNAGLPMPLAILVCLLTGTFCGMLNGFLLTRFRELASMIVTLSTQIIYRGIAKIILGDQATGGFPAWFSTFGTYKGNVGPIPMIVIVFAVFAVVFATVLRRTRFGRELYAMGSNMTVSRYSGINVNRNIFIVYTLNGLMAAVTAIFLASRMSSVRSDIAMSYEMDIIAMVVLGGISTAGGKGNLTGVILSAFVIGLLRYGLGLRNISASILMIIIGILLIAAVALPEIKGVAGRIRENRRKL